jgi:hypothetical protein
LTPWADPDPCHLLVRLSWWCGVEHRYDFDQFIVFLDNGDLDHVIFIGDPFFSVPHTW